MLSRGKLFVTTHRISQKFLGILTCGLLCAAAPPALAGNTTVDLAFQLAKELKIEVDSPTEALKALQGRDIIPTEVFSSDPVTANVAQIIGTGMIKAGISAEETAQTLAAAATKASVPLKEVVEGAVAAVIMSGSNPAKASKAASESAVTASATLLAGPMTKGKYIKRFFLNKKTRHAGAAPYVSEKQVDFASVIKKLVSKGEKSLLASKPNDPLTRHNLLILSYILAGGKPGTSIGDKKLFLKKRGLIAPQDVGLIKSYQGNATITHKDQKKGVRVTGNEAILYLDIGETELNARLELQFDDESTLTISEGTILTIDNMVYNPRTKYRSIKLRVKSGTIRIQTAKNSNPKSKFSVVTPSTVIGIRGTDVYMNIAANGTSNVTSNPGANAGNVVMRGVTRSDRPPAPTTPPPGSAPTLPATPAQAPPPVTITPGNSSSAAVGQNIPTPPAPSAPALMKSFAIATAINNPSPPQPMSVAGEAASSAANAVALGAVAATQALGGKTAAVASAVSQGAIVAAQAAGASPGLVAMATASGSVTAVQAAGGNTAAVANAVFHGAIQGAQDSGANIGVIAAASGNGAILAAQSTGGNVAQVANAAAQGAIQGAKAAGANVTAVAQATSEGMSQGAQIAGANAGAVANAASQGTIAATSATGGDVAAAANAATRGVVAGTQGMGGNTGAASQAASSGAIVAGAKVGGNVATIASAMASGAMTAAQLSGANVDAVAQAVSAGAIQAAAQPPPGNPLVNTDTIAQAVAQGSIQAAQATGADIAAVAQGTSSGTVAAAQSAGANTGNIAKFTARAIMQAAQAAGANLTIVAQGSSIGAIQAAAASGANVNKIVQAFSTGIIQGTGAKNVALVAQAAAAGVVSGAATVQQAIIQRKKLPVLMSKTSLPYPKINATAIAQVSAKAMVQAIKTGSEPGTPGESTPDVPPPNVTQIVQAVAQGAASSAAYHTAIQGPKISAGSTGTSPTEFNAGAIATAVAQTATQAFQTSRRGASSISGTPPIKLGAIVAQVTQRAQQVQAHTQKNIQLHSDGSRYPPPPTITLASDPLSRTTSPKKFSGRELISAFKALTMRKFLGLNLGVLTFLALTIGIIVFMFRRRLFSNKSTIQKKSDLLNRLTQLFGGGNTRLGGE